MSAIAGIIRFDGCPIETATLERVQGILAVYGKDAQNQSYRRTEAFLRTLLRTTPEDSLDRQPLVHTESGTTLVFDGRIDNRDELAQALGLRTSEAALMADSDLVLRACLKWDTQAVEHLLGNFALACWQADRRRLWLARDPLGYRALFWHRQTDFFAFATMPKALFAIPRIPRALCEERLHDYLCTLPMIGPSSFFKDIYRVEPGQIVVLEQQQLTTHRYHQFDPTREIRLSTDDDYVEALREHLERATSCCLRSNGPIASHLSSGFDSSTVTAVAARQLAARNTGLLAYTAVPREGFAGPVRKGWHFDEEPGARALASQFTNIEHILIRPDGTSPIDNLQENTEVLDRAPYNPVNVVWDNAIRTDAVRRGVKVLLIGGMGNMTISYDGWPSVPALLGRGRWITWWKENRAIKRRWPRMTWRELIKWSILPFVPIPLWVALERYRGRDWVLTDYSAINPDFMARMRTNERAKQTNCDLSFRPSANGRRMRIAALTQLDNGEYFAADHAVGLDRRDPTADLRLIEFCLSVPDSQYWREGQSCWLLRRLMGNVLPREILESRTKGRQAADWHEDTAKALPRLREELANMMANDSVKKYLDLDALNQALAAWPESGWETHDNEKTYRLKLMRGLSVGAFIRYIDSNNS